MGAPIDMNDAVAAELRAEVARQRISTTRLAEVAGVPYPSLRRYLNGERAISVSVLQAVSEALGVAAATVLAAGAERLEQP